MTQRGAAGEGGAAVCASSGPRGGNGARGGRASTSGPYSAAACAEGEEREASILASGCPAIAACEVCATLHSPEAADGMLPAQNMALIARLRAWSADASRSPGVEPSSKRPGGQEMVQLLAIIFVQGAEDVSDSPIVLLRRRWLSEGTSLCLAISR